MCIELGRLTDDRLVIASNETLPADIRRVEYYRDQKLFLLVYENGETADDLMPGELSPDVAKLVEKSPNALVIVMAPKGLEPYGYTVPLIQIGV